MFVLILLGGAVLVSAAAWLIDKVASNTAKPTLEAGLAAKLERLQPPDGGLVPADDPLFGAGRCVDDDALRLLLGPTDARP